MSPMQMYQVEIRHEGLHKYRLIKGSERYVVEQKAEAQMRTWNEQWEKKQAIEDTRERRRQAVQEKEGKKRLAEERTEEAQKILKGIENTLVYTLDINDKIEWESLLDHQPFAKVQPPEPKLHPLPVEPKDTDIEFSPIRKWYHFIFKGMWQKCLDESKLKFSNALEHWRKETKIAEEENKKIITEHSRDVAIWKSHKSQYEKEQSEKNDRILGKKAQYIKQDSQAVLEYCDLVLSRSQYPDTFPQEWNLEYQSETKIIVVDYILPSPEELPTLKEVKYVASKDEFVEASLQEAAINKLYDSLLYQICLRTIHELYEADQISSIQAVIFNGWVHSIDKGTGKPTTGCVLSVQAPRNEFQKINLANVEPKTCFKTLKGVGSSKLFSLTPIAPILQLNKEDKRFISSYSVVGGVDQSTNLAAMDWEDFEHLIRELFEKEFSLNGGEVKITQASKDGGVDAVAFDPDPIRGGKIVIQAKRYTNTVGVSAVRDLYGTVVNEGANKGILVSTADYGPDAYSFAKGKPLTLLNGANLLHLLDKHGHRATIDLKAAKQIIADQKRAGEV